MRGLLENLETTHYAKIFFNERFESELEILYDIQQEKYSKLLLKSFKYITDILVNIIPHGAKVRIPAKQTSKDHKGFMNKTESLRRTGQIPQLNLNYLQSIKPCGESPRTEDHETNMHRSSKDVYIDNSANYNQLSNLLTSKDSQRM